MAKMTLKEITSNPATMRDMVSELASGNSLISMCEDWGLKYGDVFAWVRLDKERFQAYNESLNARNEWAKESVLLELRRIGLADIRRLFDEEGLLLPVHDWPTDVAKFVSNIETKEIWEENSEGKNEKVGETHKIKLWNKEKALELIGKNIAMFTEHHSHSGHISLEELVESSREVEDE